ncbi:Metacaspase-1 [Hibiscus syriacus]|uniref:Metacaspase-1 n=1 Tax=Hibiscus syriacus TaxID=106335 RepID=A0A6A2YAY0_HIBSY|nr:Metacaspase-1 [Hibiscus syriacus]
MYQPPGPGMYHNYPPPTLVDCSGCRTPLQLPQGARSIRCAICKAVTNIADPRSTPPPSQPPAPSSHVPPPSSSSPPSPFNHTPPGAPPHARGRKRAVICGISYRYSRHELKGCINDAKCMRYLLVNRFKFPEDSILMLTEEETDPYRLPTKHNLRMALYWLVQGCQPGDSLLFHYSGHGSRQRNYNGDEVDEVDALFLSRVGQYVWEDHRPASGLWKGTNGGEVISFSGCDDDQTSADTSALSKITSTGAMTFCFIQAIERGHGATYGSILTAMRNAILSVDSGGGDLTGGAVTSLVTMLLTGGSTAGLGGGLRQEPQLTACQPFDVYTKPFVL